MTKGVIVKPVNVIHGMPFNCTVVALSICSEFPTRIFLGRKLKYHLPKHVSAAPLCLGGAPEKQKEQDRELSQDSFGHSDKFQWDKMASNVNLLLPLLPR